jgi:hypothetical protein
MSFRFFRWLSRLFLTRVFLSSLIVHVYTVDTQPVSLLSVSLLIEGISTVRTTRSLSLSSRLNFAHSVLSTSSWPCSSKGDYSPIGRVSTSQPISHMVPSAYELLVPSRYSDLCSRNCNSVLFANAVREIFSSLQVVKAWLRDPGKHCRCYKSGLDQ